MTDRVTSDETRITIGASKSNNPIINEVTSDSTEVTGKAERNAKVRVILEDNTEYVGFADGSRKL